MRDILIVGAGMAGLTSAIYAARAGKSVLVLEREGLGGQIAKSPRVENFPGVGAVSGAVLADNLYEQAISFGAEIDFCTVGAIHAENGAFTVLSDDAPLSVRSVILATGVHHKTLGVEGEQALVGKGVSYCPICDGAFFRGEDVAVVGGGSTATQGALYLSEICRSVTLIHRRDFFRAEEHLVSAVRTRENIRLQMESRVSALYSEEKLSGVALTTPQGEQKLLVSALFVCVGQSPDNAAFAEAVALDEAGYIVAGEDCKTSREGIFAAGDCRKKSVRQLTTAAADGTIAALNACHYLSERKAL